MHLSAKTTKKQAEKNADDLRPGLSSDSKMVKKEAEKIPMICVERHLPAYCPLPAAQRPTQRRLPAAQRPTRVLPLRDRKELQTCFLKLEQLMELLMKSVLARVFVRLSPPFFAWDAISGGVAVPYSARLA